MFLRYFVVDATDQFRLVDETIMEDVWNGRYSTDELPWPFEDELRVVSALCDDECLTPRMCFFLRTQLSDGMITDASRFEAYEAMTKHNQRRYDTPQANYQLAGWPLDWQSQLAVALDVPVMQLNRVGIGGPLLMADLWGFSIERILEYFDEASDD